MTRIVFTCLALAAVSSAVSSGVVLGDDPDDKAADRKAADQQADKDFLHHSLPLFDGESLAGWEGNAYWFRIEEDSIVAGRLDEKIPHNEFLCTTQNYDDFELRFEAKLAGEGHNAGQAVNITAALAVKALMEREGPWNPW